MMQTLVVRKDTMNGRFASKMAFLGLFLATSCFAFDPSVAPIQLIGMLPGYSQDLAKAHLGHLPAVSTTGDTLGVTMHPNGNVQVRRTLQDGKASGLEEIFLADGTLIASRTYKNGKLHGLETVYLSDGLGKAIEIPWNNGHIDGEVTMFHPDGSTRATMIFVNDTLEGPARTFWPGGKLLSQVQYTNGKPNGVALHYMPAGDVFARSLYHMGACVRVSHLASRTSEARQTP